MASVNQNIRVDSAQAEGMAGVDVVFTDVFKRQQNRNITGRAHLSGSLPPFLEPVLMIMVAAHAVGRTASLWRPHLSSWWDTAGMVMLPPLHLKTWDHIQSGCVCVDLGFA